MRTKTPLGCWRKAIKLMRDAGFPFVVVQTAPNQSWDGKIGRLITPSKSFSDLSNAIHEFAHWLVATKEDRTKPEFGLGSGPDATGNTAVLNHDNQRMEEQASLLGIAIERELGMPWKRTFCEHCWMDNCSRGNRSTYIKKHGGEQLFKKKLIGSGLRWTRRTEPF